MDDLDNEGPCIKGRRIYTQDSLEANSFGKLGVSEYQAIFSLLCFEDITSGVRKEEHSVDNNKTYVCCIFHIIGET